MKRKRREPEVPEARVPVVECLDGHARITSKELAPIHSVKNGTLQNACSTRPRMDADKGKSALMHIVRLMNSLVKRSKKNDDKCAVAMLKITRQLGCLFQDMEPPESSSTLRKSTKVLGPIRRVHFSKATRHHENIRESNLDRC